MHSSARPPSSQTDDNIRSALSHDRILVTGGAGFIGGHVVSRLLTAGSTVGVLDNFSSGTWSNLVPTIGRGLAETDVIEADIRSSDTMAKVVRWAPTLIVHLAAQSKVALSLRDPVHDAEVNIIGTLNILAAARAAGVLYVVAASSGGTIYGQAGACGEKISEAVREAPASPYGVAKAAVDDYLSLFRQEYGLRSASPAIANAYGPSAGGGPGEGVVASFATSLATGQPATIHGDGGQTRDFVYVDDVADAFIRACACRPESRINIGTGVSTSVHCLLSQLATATGQSPQVRRMPPLPGEVRHVRLDIRRAANLLGWRPRVPLAVGIRHVIDAACAMRAAI